MSRMRWFFLFFFFSGLCSLMYEVIWLRLGMAQFGVTTALISLFLSIFLAGLGLGSWGFGKLARRLESHPKISFLRGYAVAELFIGISAIIVPTELLWARRTLDWARARAATAVSTVRTKARRNPSSAAAPPSAPLSPELKPPPH